MPTKLPQYMLPTFPVVALLAALGVRQWEGKLADKALKIFLGIWFVISSTLGIACGLGSYLLTGKLNYIALIVAIWIIVISAGVFYSMVRGYCKFALIGIFLLALLSYPLILGNILPGLRLLWLSTTIVQRIPKGILTAQNLLLSCWI